MWQRFDRNDFAARDKWDVACTKRGVPCFSIYGSQRKYDVEWQFDTHDHERWEKLREANKRPLILSMFGAFQNCTKSRNAEFLGHALDGTISGVTLDEAVKNSGALFWIVG